MSTSQPRPPDKLVVALDPLVRDGTLTPGQANRALVALRSAGVDPETRARGWREVDKVEYALGGAILGAALVAAGLFVTMSLGGRDFDAKIFFPMLVLSAGLAAAAGAIHLLGSSQVLARVLTGTLATLALVGLAATLLRAWDNAAMIYLVSAGLALAGAAGYWYLRQDLLLLPAVFGGVMFLGQLASDTFLDGSDVDASWSGRVLGLGLLMVLFGVAVMAVGWRLPCRHFAGLIGGAVAVGSMVLAMFTIGVGYLVAMAFTDVGGRASFEVDSDIRSDITGALIVGLALCIGLIVLYAVSGYRGYAVIAFAGGLLLPAQATAYLATTHPLRTAMAYALIGALAVAGAIVLAWRGGGSAGPDRPAQAPTVPGATPPPAPSGPGGPRAGDSEGGLPYPPPDAQEPTQVIPTVPPGSPTEGLEKPR